MRTMFMLVWMALTAGGCRTPTAAPADPEPFRVTFGRRVTWTEGAVGFDPKLPGYRVTGDIGHLVLHPKDAPLPEALVIAIRTSPGQRPMLEHLEVSTADIRIETSMSEGVTVDTVRHLQTGETHEVKKGAYFKIDVVGEDVRVTLRPAAMKLLRQDCRISWIDWYR